MTEQEFGVTASQPFCGPSGEAAKASSAKPAATNAERAPHDFTDEYRANVCRIGQGEACCRYLTMGGRGFECAKRTSMRFTIDHRAATMGAKGDNCEGLYRPRPAFRLLFERFGNPPGTIIYEASGYDYGCASDDERMTGKPHTSMTLDPAGDYPFFTVPNEDFASVDTLPKGQDGEAGLVRSKGSAVPEGQTPKGVSS